MILGVSWGLRVLEPIRFFIKEFGGAEKEVMKESPFLGGDGRRDDKKGRDELSLP